MRHRGIALVSPRALAVSAVAAFALAVTLLVILPSTRSSAQKTTSAEHLATQVASDEGPSYEPTPTDGFAAKHPLVTVLALTALVVLLLTVGAVFTITWLGHTLAPLQSVLAFFAWVVGIGSTSSTPH